MRKGINSRCKHVGLFLSIFISHLESCLVFPRIFSTVMFALFKPLSWITTLNSCHKVCLQIAISLGFPHCACNMTLAANQDKGFENLTVINGPEDQLIFKAFIESQLWMGSPRGCAHHHCSHWMMLRRSNSALPNNRVGASVLTRVPRRMFASSWSRSVMPIKCC